MPSPLHTTHKDAPQILKLIYLQKASEDLSLYHLRVMGPISKTLSNKPIMSYLAVLSRAVLIPPEVGNHLAAGICSGSGPTYRRCSRAETGTTLLLALLEPYKPSPAPPSPAASLPPPVLGWRITSSSLNPSCQDWHMPPGQHFANGTCPLEKQPALPSWMQQLLGWLSCPVTSGQVSWSLVTQWAK